jgi:HK97 family phage prohead protease
VAFLCLLWQHDVKFPLAIPQLKEDSTGLHFDSVISRTSYGRDVLQLYLDGICNEHSIGFNSIQKSAKKGYNEITEIRLWEGSSVTWGSNQFAIGSVEKSQQRMDILLKAYKNGRYENEDIFLQIENSIKQLTQTANTQPAPKAPVSNANDAALLLIKQQIDKFYGDKYRNQTGFGAIEQGCCGAGGCA